MIVADPVVLDSIHTAAPFPLHWITTGEPVPTLLGSGDGEMSQYVFIQNTPATVWTITHGLGRRPAAVALFSLNYADEYEEFHVQHLSAVQLRVSMDVPLAGVALVE